MHVEESNSKLVSQLSWYLEDVKAQSKYHGLIYKYSFFGKGNDTPLYIGAACGSAQKDLSSIMKRRDLQHRRSTDGFGCGVGVFDPFLKMFGLVVEGPQIIETTKKYGKDFIRDHILKMERRWISELKPLLNVTVRKGDAVDEYRQYFQRMRGVTNDKL